MKNIYIFILCGLLCAATFTARAQSGTTGDLSWSIAGGVLTITGAGAMPDYATSTGAPWYANRSAITGVTIGSGITRIDNYAFYRCSAMTAVTIPESVAAIGNYVFYSCP
jgi:hypothetical protein